jgi:predicted CDP-diglyceride synthetase/phosphatidate cytidylyltransferase
MSTVPRAARDRPAETVAGFLAALAMVGGAIAVVERPVAIGVVSIFIGFLAAAMAERNQRLAAAGVTIAALGFLGGMIVSVITSRPLW